MGKSDERFEGKATIYVRVGPELKKRFSDIADATPDLSQGNIIEKLLEYFLEQPLEVRKAILSGNHTDPVKRFGELIEIQSWADKAETAEKWIWALEEYRKLETRAEYAEGLKRFSWYKQAYCLAKIARTLRLQAIQLGGKDNSVDWKRQFQLAEQALITSTATIDKMTASLNSEAITKTPTQHSVGLFNIACYSSLQAQYLIEEALGPKNPAFKPLRASLDNETEKKLSFQAWKEIGIKWKEILPSQLSARQFSKLRDSVNEHARISLEKLKAVSSDVATSQGHTEWIIETAQADYDLIFMRTDQHWGEQFGNWLSNCKIASLADSFESLKNQAQQTYGND